MTNTLLFYFIYIAMIISFFVYIANRNKKKKTASLNALLEEMNQATKRCQYCRSTSFIYEYKTQYFWRDYEIVRIGNKTEVVHDGTADRINGYFVRCSNCGRGAWHFDDEQPDGYVSWEDQKTERVNRETLIELFTKNKLSKAKSGFAISLFFICIIAVMLILPILFGWIW